jgi:hypothetical protein
LGRGGLSEERDREPLTRDEVSLSSSMDDPIPLGDLVAGFHSVDESTKMVISDRLGSDSLLMWEGLFDDEELRVCSIFFGGRVQAFM